MPSGKEILHYMKKNILWGSALILVGSAVIYHWIKVSNENSVKRLEHRVNEYWEAMKTNDLHTIYYMQDKTAKGDLRPDQSYRGNPDGIQTRSFIVENVSVDGSAAKVKVKTTITFSELNGKEINGGISSEEWVKIKGEWYRKMPDLPPEVLETSEGNPPSIDAKDK